VSEGESKPAARTPKDKIKNKNNFKKRKRYKTMTNTNNTPNNFTIRINDSKRAIEITKAFSKLASIYGSEAYNALKGAKADNPTYRVCIKSPSKKKLEDRITMDDIVAYVEEKSGAESAEMATLKELRGTSIKEAGSLLKVEETASFPKIKKWFFLTYSEVAKKSEIRQNRIDAIIAEAANHAASV
jgi:hypothetical protein